MFSIEAENAGNSDLLPNFSTKSGDVLAILAMQSLMQRSHVTIQHIFVTTQIAPEIRQFKTENVSLQV